MTDSPRTSDFGQFLAEMKRRHVVRFALGYAAVFFVALQLAEIVFPAFGIGEGGVRLLVAVATLGFPPALVLAWMYDITREGIKRTSGGGQEGPLLPRLALGALLIVTVLATGGAGLYLARQGVFESELPRGRASAPSAIRAASYDPAQPIRSIAVLPLDDYSPGGDQAYFVSSMHEEIIAKLGALDNIRVVSRTTVMRYAGTELTMPELGRELDVDVVVTGSVSRTPQRTRVTLEIVHAPSDSHIRTLQWDRAEIEDYLAFQTEIAHEVVEEIGSRHDEDSFTRTASSVDADAQEAYFRGRYAYELGTPEGYRSALDYFDRALSEDSTFAAAMAGRAGARFLIGLEGDSASPDELAMAREEARAALALDSGSVEAKEVLTLIERSLPRIFTDRTDGVPRPVPPPPETRIVRIPGMPDSIAIDVSAFDTAWVSAVTSLGERIEARVRERNVAPEQEEPGRLAFEARQGMISGRYAEAARALERLVADDPDAAAAWDMLSRARMARGDLVGAVRTVEAWSATGAPGAPSADEVARLRTAVESERERGYWSWRRDRLQRLAQSGGRVPHFELATANAALGDADEAFRHLFAALEAGDPAALSIRSDPAWDDLRTDPRFREAARQARTVRFGAARRPGSGG